MNGGTVVIEDETWWLHPIRDTTDRKRMSRSANHIAAETAGLRDLEWFPEGAVAVGANGAGDRLIFLPDLTQPASLRPGVFTWRMRSGEIGQVADDFADLDNRDELRRANHDQ